MAKFYIKVTDVELGMELNMDELVTFGEAFSEALTPELIDKFEALLKKAKTNPVKKEEPEEDDEVEGLVECNTYDHGPYGKAKYSLVKSWLKTGEIEYEEETVYGDKRLNYTLTGSDLSAMQKYLDDNEIASYKATI